ncbi:endosomal SPRY domain-containing [Pyrenophora seminiperda CCB06]|uniref:Endosomal SPRY domain-containing n=1 Tax=Pyrenophora seminiperda CCB06 TaxID=1302712 RepID=A0A3M7LVZ1_9PLEO|nr:endosomal SPRY domain-containing [Pyrenophora seminiperda CCB06]
MAPRPDVTADDGALSPMAVNALQLAKSWVKRDNAPYKNLASAGARPPNDLSGPGFQALFALIGVGLALGAIWFFFWAKNGGFKWRDNDWEDYKSTVLRRKGPDGKTLSNATKSTRLGGGSVVHGGSYFGAQSDLGYTDETGTSVDASEYRDAERGEGGLRGGDGRKSKKKHRRDHTNDYKDPELRQYREEKPARVGGLNRVGDGMYTDYSGSQPSELGSQVSSNVPLVKKEPTKEVKEVKDPKKEAKAKEMRARERMRKAKAAEKETARKEAAEAKARKEEQKAEAKRAKEEQKKNKKHNPTPSEAPEMAEVNRPLTEYTSPQSEYTRAYTEYTAPSEAGTPSRAPTKSKALTGPRRAPPSAAYSFTTGDDDNATVYTGVSTSDFAAPKTQRTALSDVAESSYYSDYRPNADPSVYSDPNKHAPRSRSARPSQDRTSRSGRPTSESRPRPSGSRSRPTSESPRKQHRTSRPAPPPSDIFTTTNGDAQGHMSYPCHIPGLSQAGSVHPMESVSQVGIPTNARRERGGRDVMDGYRRGGVRAVGRRDSLSDSD